VELPEAPKKLEAVLIAAEAKVEEALAEIKEAATAVAEVIPEVVAVKVAEALSEVAEVVAEVTEAGVKVAEVVPEVTEAHLDVVKEAEITVLQTRAEEAFSSIWPRSEMKEINKIIFNSVIDPSKKLKRLPSLPRSPRRF
jgi:hypothetical protein